MISEDRTRKPSIDAAVAKELKRRAFVVWCLWVLVALAVMLTCWIVYEGINAKGIAEGVAKQAVRAEAEQVLDDAKQAVSAEAEQAVKDAKQTVRAEAEQAVKALSARAGQAVNDVKQTVRAEAEQAMKDVKQTVRTEAEQAVKDAKQTVRAEAEQAVKDAKQTVRAEAEQAVKDEVKLAVKRLGSEFTETVADELVNNENFVSRIADAVSKKMQRHLFKEVLSNFRNIEQRLLVLTSEIETLKREYDTLPRNYLLKTGQWNDLTSLGMKVKIDRKIGKDISEFSAQKKGSELCGESEVKIGQQFMCGNETDRYRIELTYFVNRFIVNDYVGMEIVLVPSD